MQLLFLLLLVLAPFVILSLAGDWFPQLKLPVSVRAKVGLSIFFSFAAIGHFIRTDQMAAMLPPWAPYRVELIYVTGVFEFLGAVAVWAPSLMRLTGVCLILMLLCVLPANIYAAIERVDFGGHAAGPIYLLLRIPFQIFLIWWTYLATEQSWFQSRSA